MFFRLGLLIKDTALGEVETLSQFKMEAPEKVDGEAVSSMYYYLYSSTLPLIKTLLFQFYQLSILCNDRTTCTCHDGKI